MAKVTDKSSTKSNSKKQSAESSNKSADESNNERVKAQPVGSPMPKQLRRVKEGAFLGGVCAGLAEYIEIDPILVRLAFVAITMAGGAGVFLYIALWILIPEGEDHEALSEESVRKNAAEMKEKAESIMDSLNKERSDKNSRVIFGVILLFLGGYFVLSNWGLLGWLHFNDVWPLILIAIGVLVIFKK